MFHSEVKYGPRLHVYLCHVSSQDDVHPADALRVQDRHSCGWVSWRNAPYPQELGFRFDGIVSVNTLRILVNESKISSCMIVYVAEPTPQEEQDGVCGPYSKADFKHIGHVRFSDNAASEYQARELKTVGLYRRCTYLKLVLRDPHVNSYNISKQIGIVALAVHGKLIKKLQDWISTPLAIHVGERVTVPLDEMMPPPPTECNQSVLTKVASINAARLLELAAKKQKAVEEEDFDTAESLKQQILAIENSDREIARLEVEKRQAVMMENYKLAKELKLRIEMLRETTENNTSHAQTKTPSTMGNRATVSLPPQDLFPAVSVAGGAAVQNYDNDNGTASPPPPHGSSNAHDEVVVGGKGYYDLSDFTGGMIVKEPSNENGTGGDEVPLAGDGAAWEVSLNAAIKRELTGLAGPSALTGDAAAVAKPYTKDLGVYCVACLFSRKGQQREAALRGAVSNEGSQALSSHSSAAWTQLILYLSVKGYGIGDPVAGAAVAACTALTKIVQGGLPGTLAHHVESVTRVLPELTARLGESNMRVQENVERTVLALAHSPFGHQRIVEVLLVDPDKQNKKPASIRAHVSRINILSTFVDDFGLMCKTSDGLDTHGLCTMVLLPSLQHSNVDVREAAVDLLAKLLFLDPDSTSGYVENIKPAQQALVEEHLQQYKQSQFVSPSISRKVSDIQTEKSYAQRNGMGSAVLEKAPPQGPSVPYVAGASTAAPEVLQPCVSSEPPLQRSPASVGEVEYRWLRTCQFCGEYNSSFNEHNLDLHYVSACPMLCPCPLCDQVTEICQLQQHLVTECEKRRLVRECPLCQEAVRATEYDKHVSARRCIKAVPTHSVCPLCHARFKSGMDEWRHHLASSPGCPNNPRCYDGSGCST
ncbi:hypothetical protein JKF63_05745 [Porcisia hertigi]|uniref:TOG domain-containing protein n=1 Tax=Porcisia hertigi TaxID=2761500 RepID=A0A836I822_9TRYP|nr:hypothetical protein JKF63_05745 [Porcisia hertigi]